MSLLKVLLLLLILLTSNFASATLINENGCLILDETDCIAESDYYTLYHSDIEMSLDWIWASNVNVQFYTEGVDYSNVLHAANEIAGWRDAKDYELEFFLDNVIANDFLNESGHFKNGVRFFNSDASMVVSEKELNDDRVKGTFREDTRMDLYSSYYDEGAHDTFYVRNSSVNSGGSPAQPIPEPISVFLLAIGTLLLKLVRKSH